MKTKILFLVLILVAVLVTFQMNVKHERLDNVMLENLEALSSGEWEGPIVCIGSGCVDCPISNVKVYIVTSINGFADFD